MATSTTGAHSTTTDANDDSLAGRGLAAVDEVVSAARGSVNEVAARLPDAAEATRNVLMQAERQINEGSDEMVSIAAALAFGFAAGLLVGGSNRLIIAVALVPAAFLGGSLVTRLSPSPRD